MRLAEAKQAKIAEVIAYIQERLEELESEKEELKEFQEKDKERRCLEYSLYQAELTEIVEAMDEVLSYASSSPHNQNFNSWLVIRWRTSENRKT